jgi:hypothetical protein
MTDDAFDTAVFDRARHGSACADMQILATTIFPAQSSRWLRPARQPEREPRTRLSQQGDSQTLTRVCKDSPFSAVRVGPITK